jgi:hypothetical protein
LESRFEALHSAALTPLVGREEEIELLRSRWAQAVAGTGRVVQPLLQTTVGNGLSFDPLSFGQDSVRVLEACHLVARRVTTSRGVRRRLAADLAGTCIADDPETFGRSRKHLPVKKKELPTRWFGACGR